MDPQEVLNLIRKRPFEPFVVRLHDGREFPIRHPEMALVTRRSVFIGLYTETRDGPVDDWVLVSPVAIASLHPHAA